MARTSSRCARAPRRAMRPALSACAAKKEQAFDIRVFARALRSPLDPVLHIAKKGGAYLAGNDDSNGPDCYIRFGVPEDGEYVLYLHDHLKKGGPDYAYRIEVGP